MYAPNKLEIENTYCQQENFIVNSRIAKSPKAKAIEVVSNSSGFFCTPYETQNLSLDDSRPSSPPLQYQEAPRNEDPRNEAPRNYTKNAEVSRQNTSDYTLFPDYLTNQSEFYPYPIKTPKKTEASTQTSPDILWESISSLCSSIINIFEYISNSLKTPNNQEVGKNKIRDANSSPSQILKSLECVSNLFCCFPPNNSQREP